MRLLFINHCHPDTPHVCATRAREFARACARAGHQVVLLTQTLPEFNTVPPVNPKALAGALDSHDWTDPFYLACPPLGGRWLEAQRAGRLPRLLRRPLLAALYLARTGVFPDWRDGTRPAWRVLADHFRPQMVWPVFGNTDALVIGRSVARMAGCPWVMDVKDPWSVFIPSPLRRILASRFKDAAALTALSAQHRDDTVKWFKGEATIVSSGIDDGFLPRPLPPPSSGPVRLMVVGGLYDDAHLAQLVGGIARWRAETGREALVVYAGSEIERFRSAFAGLPVETPGYVDLAELRRLAAQCHAMLYVRNPAALYQHKVIELLALERPVFCIPDEAPEALAIAAELGAVLHSCPDAASLASALAGLVGRPLDGIDETVLAKFTWDFQAGKLLAVFEDSVSQHSKNALN